MTSETRLPPPSPAGGDVGTGVAMIPACRAKPTNGSESTSADSSTQLVRKARSAIFQSLGARRLVASRLLFRIPMTPMARPVIARPEFTRSEIDRLLWSRSTAASRDPLRRGTGGRPAARRPARLRGLGDSRPDPEALRLQGPAKTYMLLGHILVAQKVITRSQLLSVLDRHRQRSSSASCWSSRRRSRQASSRWRSPNSGGGSRRSARWSFG